MHDTKAADVGSVSRWQTVAELRAAVPAMPIVLHDIGPVDGWGTKTYLDIKLRDGRVRLGSAHDTEAEQDQNDRGYAYSIELPADMTGRQLADALEEVEVRMPEVVAGYGEDDEEGMVGFAGLTTDESARMLRGIHMIFSRRRVTATSRMTFELSAVTDLGELMIRHPPLEPFRTALQQMVEDGHAGWLHVETDFDEPLDANGRLVPEGIRVDAMLIEGSGYVAVASNGETLWCESSNIEDALEAFHAGYGKAA